MTKQDENIICLNCGYDLRGTPGDVCSECGKAFDRENYKQSVIPWERAVYGVWRFPMTLIATTFWAKRMRGDVYKTHDPKRARRFALSVWFLCALPLLILFGQTYFSVQNFSAKLIEFHNLHMQEALRYLGSTRNPDVVLAYLSECFLLLGMAFKGRLGVIVGALVIGMWGWDWVHAPGAALRVLGRKRESAIGEGEIGAVGRYLSGPVGLAAIFFWGGVLFLQPCIKRWQGLELFLWVSILCGLSWLLTIICLFQRVWRCNQAIYRNSSAGIVESYYQLLKTFVWRWVFWVILIPCFIGFIRLIIESVIWAY